MRQVSSTPVCTDMGNRFGGLTDIVLSMDDTFDDELEDFSEYMPQATSCVA